MLDLAERPTIAQTVDEKVCPITGARVAAELAERDAAEWLVATVMRCRMAGYEFGDISCWELGNEILTERLGPMGALVEAEIAGFARGLRRMMTRPFAYNAHPARALAGDEAVLLDLVALAGAEDPEAERLAGVLVADATALVALAKTMSVRLSKAGLALKVQRAA